MGADLVEHRDEHGTDNGGDDDRRRRVEELGPVELHPDDRDAYSARRPQFTCCRVQSAPAGGVLAAPATTIQMIESWRMVRMDTH